MSIIINTEPTLENLVGKSHWWGAPDLPKNVSYPANPEPLTFVCQIRCKDIEKLDSQNLLPHEGMLYFFAPIDYFLGYIDSPLDYHDKPVVIYHPNEENLEPYQLCWEDSDESVFLPSEKIVFAKSRKSEADGMLMLGKPYQDDVAYQYPDAVCLLQVDCEDRWNLRFFDMGMYYFLIPKPALLLGKWDEVFGELFTY